MTETTTKPDTTASATNVSEFIGDLDGTNFERKLSAALSLVAAAAVDHKKSGEVNISFKFAHIPGSNQVLCEHVLKFTKPTLDGKSGEEEKRSTVLHVGRFGALSLAQPSLMGKPATQRDL